MAYGVSNQLGFLCLLAVFRRRIVLNTMQALLLTYLLDTAITSTVIGFPGFFSAAFLESLFVLLVVCYADLFQARNILFNFPYLSSHLHLRTTLSIYSIRGHSATGRSSRHSTHRRCYLPFVCLLSVADC